MSTTISSTSDELTRTPVPNVSTARTRSPVFISRDLRSRLRHVFGTRRSLPHSPASSNFGQRTVSGLLSTRNAPGAPRRPRTAAAPEEARNECGGRAYRIGRSASLGKLYRSTSVRSWHPIGYLAGRLDPDRVQWESQPKDRLAGREGRRRGDEMTATANTLDWHWD